MTPLNSGQSGNKEKLILKKFARELDALIKTPENIEKTIKIMKKLLAGDSVESMVSERASLTSSWNSSAASYESLLIEMSEGNEKVIGASEEGLVGRVKRVKGMMDRSAYNHVNAVTEPLARSFIYLFGDEFKKALLDMEKLPVFSQMEEMLSNKVAQLEHLKACKEVCQRMLPGLSSNGIQTLITVVEGCFERALVENLPPEKAISSALVKGMLSSFIGEPDINKNTALRADLEADGELSDYLCGIMLDFVGSDAVMLVGKEELGNTPQRYHRSALEEHFDQGGEKDPYSNVPRTKDDIVPDPKAEQVIKNAIRSWIDSKMKDVPSSFEGKVLMDKGLLFAVAAAYPQVKEKYETILRESHDVTKTLEEVEIFAEKVISPFMSLRDRINAYIGKAPSPCAPYMEEFMREVAEKATTGVPLEEMMRELEDKIAVFVDFFRRIDFIPLSSSSKEEVLAIVREAISKATPLNEVEALFLECIKSAEIEEKARSECPGCVIGTKEWKPLAVVGKAPPFTEKMLEALHETSPSDKAKEAWQTGHLVLIPEFVDGEPLTINRLWELMKKDSPNKKIPFGDINQVIVDSYGETPAGKSRWVLIEKDILPKSKNKGFQEQEAMIKVPYGLPELLPVTVGIILNRLNFENEKLQYGSREMNSTFASIEMTCTRCKEMIENGPVLPPSHVTVNPTTFGGPRISRGYSDNASPNAGITAQRNL